MDLLRFTEDGLIPVIVQDVWTKEVLMLAYMNRQSLEQSLVTGETWFFSRSRRQLWHKGESSGHVQTIVRISYDCDGDALLCEVEPAGPACHTGETTCFYRQLFHDKADEVRVSESSIISKLFALILERRAYPIEGSYTDYLFSKGLDKILKKVGEEATEVVIGAKNRSQAELIYEMADLTYHLLVLLAEMECTPDEVKAELIKRFKQVSE